METIRKPLSIRLSGLEKKALEIMAHQEGVCPAEMMRILLREGTQMRGIRPLIFAGEFQQFNYEVIHEGT